MILSILTGGDLIGDLFGIAAGHIYYYFKDVFPLTFRKDFLLTPSFMRRIDNYGSSNEINNQRNLRENISYNLNSFLIDPSNRDNRAQINSGNSNRGSFQSYE